MSARYSRLDNLPFSAQVVADVAPPIAAGISEYFDQHILAFCLGALSTLKDFVTAGESESIPKKITTAMAILMASDALIGILAYESCKLFQTYL